MNIKHTPKPLADLEAVAYKLQRERNVALEQRDALLAALIQIRDMDYVPQFAERVAEIARAAIEQTALLRIVINRAVMSTKHTPGPWRVGKDGNVHETFLLAELRGIYREKNANAAFIVRACNNHDALLAALQRLVIWDEYGTSDDAVLDSIMSEARAAIAACEVQS